MQIYRIKTTAWEEEDLVLLTTLKESEIERVITPIVYREREGGREYDNDDLVNALKKEFPTAHVEQYQTELPVIII
jgi:hypothetical protein